VNYLIQVRAAFPHYMLSSMSTDISLAGWQVPLARRRHVASDVPHHRRSGLVLPGRWRGCRLSMFLLLYDAGVSR